MHKIDKATNDIYMTRGDDTSFEFKLVDANAKAYVPQPRDTFVFTMKRNIKDTRPLIEKKFDYKSQLRLSSADTKNLEFGMYIYDIQMFIGDKLAQTVIPSATLYLCEEVG